MMQGQLIDMLTNFYNEALKSTEKYLRESGYILEICKKDDKDIIKLKKMPDVSFREFWKIKIDIKGIRKITLILAIPQTFPDAFPKIYLSEKDFQEIYPIPHLDKNRFICTRDPEVAVINEFKIGEATKDLLEIATNIIKSGIKKENETDYIEEFLAYWNEGTINTCLSIFNPKKEPSFLFVYKLRKRIFCCNYIITDSRIFLEKWLEPFSVTISENQVIEALYLPTKPFSPYLLNTDNDLLKIIKNEDIKYTLESYFNQDRLHNVIIASFILKDEFILFGWKHQGWKNVKIKGFRKNHIPLKIRLEHSQNRSIKKIKVIRLDRERLFKRGGLMSIPIKEDISIAILGCGSLGSFLTMSLARCGISKFMLVDKEYLLPENTPRHLCGLIEASQNMRKVEAVRKRLIEHFPNIECDVFHNDILDLLEKDENILNKNNIVLVAIGNMAIERRINYLLRNGSINSPVIFLWIEPLGVGGHVLYISPKNGGCYDCAFDEKGNFLYTISNASDYFYKRESGCQTTFMPYSGLTVGQFSIIAAKIIIKILEDLPNNSILFTWLGDIEEFEKSGHTINPIYDAQLPYRIIERQIKKRSSCVTCGNTKNIT